jgi:glutathione S-transferase
MPDQQPLSEPQARAHARAWLTRQHTDAHELVVTLLHYVPEPDRTRALSQLTTAELRHLARLLADATDLRQVARAIVADLQRHLPAQQRPNGS